KDLDPFLSSASLTDEGTAPSLVVRPSSVGELQALVRLANSSKLNLTVSSSTGRHRKGGLTAMKENVMVDLSGWRGIPWINRRNRVCLIEPGVTYGELLKALEPHGMTIPMPLAPRNGKSVVAAMMDREPTTWPNRQWDISDPVASTELVFGSGELFRTGAAGGPGTLEQQRAMGGAQKSPLGPSQTDFQRVVQGSQGTMGIATWITVRAELRPSVQRPYLLGAESLQELIPYIYDVQRQWLGEHSFVLDRTAAAMLMSAQGGGDLEEVRRSLPRFVCLQNVAGFERMPKERVEYQSNDIGAIAKRNKLTMATSLGKVSAGALLDAATRPCGEAEWRDAWKGGCLSIFFLTTLDMVPALIDAFLDTAGRTGVEQRSIGTYVQPVVQNHGCHVELMCAYDPGRSEETDSMRRLERESVARLAQEGAFFSRPYGAAGKIAFQQNPLGFEVLRKVKGIFDPNLVLNQGKWGL
ncbi:MAG TPA: FAD-binding oxidoreductase, partial [Methanomassiliicoccales archaeon]|nr:FAD-binding oxidoreductase [Methanomassiliicoccales archaeon]